MFARLPFSAPRVLRLAPGLFGLLLFGALLAGADLLGSAARPLQALLALALVASAAAQPLPRRRLASLVGAGTLHGWALLGVGVVALGLRAWGHRFGLPYFEHPDEWAVADKALAIVQTGDYNPRRFIYPHLYIYLQVPVVVLHFLWGASSGVYTTLADVDKAALYAWGRLLTALLGTGAVLAAYAVACLLYGRAIALFAAAALAVTPAAVADSHYITTDTPAAFFTTLALVPIAALALRSPALRRERLALALLGGLAVGLAASTKYNVALLGLPLLLAVVWGEAERPRDQEAHETPPAPSLPRSLASSLLLSLCGVALGFTLGTPYWLADLPRLLDDLASVVHHYQFKGHPGQEADRPWLFYAAMFYRDAPLVAALAGLGLVLAFLHRHRADLLLLAFFVPSYLQLAGLRVTFFRNAMPLLPIACIFAAVGAAALVGWVLRRLQRVPNPGRLRSFSPALLLGLLGAVALLGPLVASAQATQTLARPTTRLLATAWVLANAPAGARIWLEDQTLILPADRFRVSGGKPVVERPLAWFREQGYRYLVASASGYGREGRAQLDALAEEAPARQRFDGQGERRGPALLIIDTGLPSAADEPRTSVDAPLAGGALVLEGYRHPGVALPGAVLPLALYWRADQPLGADYTVFVHLVDAAGNKLAQRDVAPLEGSLPTSQWRVGELLRDDQDLAIPATVPPGTYQLAVGMYRPDTLEQLNADPILIGPVTVRAP